METINSLKKKLRAIKKNQNKINSARIPTRIVIDLLSPQGNVFYILWLCNQLARDYLDDAEIDIFKSELKDKNYNQILDICQQWFGLVYLGVNLAGQK
jgi:hypothetical protein